ncbi:MAG: hypothetical protein DA443_09310 [Bacteroidetes bacterium]|nr:MAG: hypothetical protein DA443_09310 [Bacteroidota bacterium]
MVEEEQSVLAVQAVNGFPGERYPSLFVTFAVPNQGVSMEDIEATIEEEIQKVKDGDITQEELDRVLTNARANQIRGLNSNFGLALGFAQNHAQTGSWKNAFTSIQKLEAVTLEDLQRVANQYLVKRNRTVGMIQSEETTVADAD